MLWAILIILIILIVFISAPFENYSNKKKGGQERMDSGKKVMVFNGYWSEQDVKNHPDWLFIYGDNDQHSGKGGQAVIRNMPNAMGIPTKKNPSTALNSYYSDTEIDDNRRKISQAISNIQDAMSKYSTLVLPKDGIGTGLSQLNSRAPLTFGYLQYRIKDLADSIQPGSSKTLSLK